jgi:hypothetical protein
MPAPIVLGWASAPVAKPLETAQVIGVLTYADQPFVGTIIFMPVDQRLPVAMAPVNPDGSFRLHVNGRKDQSGAVPGTYRIVLQPRVRGKPGTRIDAKYQHPRTTDLLVHIGPDWNHINVNLH